jgi:DNA-directed RNA polymerase specialized sigma24 family protein
MLCNLAGEYRAEYNDVLFSLMQACRKPLVNEDHTTEIRGRIRGLLQGMNRKEVRRNKTNEAYASERKEPTTKINEARLDVTRALSQLNPKDQELVIRGEIEGATDQELAEEKQKGTASIKKARQRATDRLRDELEED